MPPKKNLNGIVKVGTVEPVPNRPRPTLDPDELKMQEFLKEFEAIDPKGKGANVAQYKILFGMYMLISKNMENCRNGNSQENKKPLDFIENYFLPATLIAVSRYGYQGFDKHSSDFITIEPSSDAMNPISAEAKTILLQAAKEHAAIFALGSENERSENGHLIGWSDLAGSSLYKMSKAVCIPGAESATMPLPAMYVSNLVIHTCSLLMNTRGTSFSLPALPTDSTHQLPPMQ